MSGLLFFIQNILLTPFILIHSYYKTFLLIITLFLFYDTLYAQRLITGSVTSTEDGNPLSGVNIAVSGHSIGTVSDMQGKYKIEIPEGDIILVFSFMGLKPCFL